MQRSLTRQLFFLFVFLLMVSGVSSQTPKARVQPNSAKREVAPPKREAHGPSIKSAAPNLAKEPTLYVVGYAHLDTEWRWEYPQVIQEYLTKTMRNNFALFEKYPHYIFNFTGANRYRLMKEYYPSDFERLKQYVATGRWFPAGSSMEEGDVNSPNAESIIRQILSGNTWFRRESGPESDNTCCPIVSAFRPHYPASWRMR